MKTTPKKRTKRERMRVMLTICGVSSKVWESCLQVPFPQGDLKTASKCHLLPPQSNFPRQIHIERTSSQKQDTDSAKTRLKDQEDESCVLEDVCGNGISLGSIVAQDGRNQNRVSTATQTHKHPRCSLL